MAAHVPSRSTKGCLTCKKRRKKCDETKPVCVRCMTGGFLCLGYGNQPKAASSSGNHTSIELAQVPSGPSPSPPYFNPTGDYSSGTSSLSDLSNSNFKWTYIDEDEHGSSLVPRSANQSTTSVPKTIFPDPSGIANLIPLIIRQCARMSGRMFRPFPVEEGIVRRVNDSEITRWTMYIGARIFQGLMEGDSQQNYMGWVNRLYRIIVTSPPSQALAVRDARARLSGLRELSTYAFMLSSNAAGYAVFKQSMPYLLRIATAFPHLWSPNSAIYIAQALYCAQYEIRAFALIDTITSLVFGVPPLLHYDPTPEPAKRGRGSRLVEWVYGCPIEIVSLLAKVNAWRAARWMEDIDSNSINLEVEESRNIEELLKSWTPEVERVDGSANLITRMAVQESWRQATSIYVYMGMCGVSSVDARIQASVKQIVQLASTVETGTILEPHLCIPCLIAAVAARRESHRALLRSKLYVSRNENIRIIRGIDFVQVLDHLWHGVGAGGAPTTWDDYVRSRRAILPIDT